MQVDYVNHMGNDLMVVNAARVSFAKHSEEFKASDEKLITYLATHGHWTPFSHPTISVRVKAPIFVARQLFKHKVGMTENEVSRRYVDDPPKFYLPSNWRVRPDNGMKQGSGSDTVQLDPNSAAFWPLELYDKCAETYYWLLTQGVAPGQARMVLPQSMYTEWYWTGSLASFARIYNLRSDPHAQQETQEVAKMIDTIVRPLFPVSWKALCEVSQ